MDDLISRQAAIDAIERNAYRHTYIDQIVDIIKELPSAQPQHEVRFSDEDHVWIDGKQYISLKRFGEAVKDAQPQHGTQPQLETCPIYGGICRYPSNLCYECPRHEGATEKPQWWTEGLQPFAQPQRWIPVTERLPERDKDVLVTRDYDGRADHIKSCRYVEVASCYGEDDDVSWNSYSDEYKMTPKNHRVVAWMPLPEPYKGEEE